ncbi:Endonuclease/exonuclease/phosphatase [Pyronema domesticum]|nr:Endonuclease/exonuclease/phosphatase [Pyronema domesticum]
MPQAGKLMPGFGQQNPHHLDQSLGHMQNTGNNNISGSHQHNISGHFGNGNYPSPQHTNSTVDMRNASTHWQEQHQLLAVSRNSGEPHYHARKAALENKNSSATLAITNSSTPNPYSNTPVSSNRKDGPPADVGEPKNAHEGERQDWNALDLGGQGLHALSNALFNYTFLDKLYINHNKLTKLPAAIGKLKLLQVLDASSNQLTELPPELGMLTNLKQLLVFDNKLNMLPFELGSLYKLEVVGVEGNPLDDSYKQILVKEGTRSLIMNLRDNSPADAIPQPPVERDWIVLDDTKNPNAEIDSFQVVSYNILCEKYATANQYGYAANWTLDWQYRRERILNQLIESKADIVCLQEVDAESYDEYLVPNMANSNYDGYHQVKTRARTMSPSESKKVDGCATFWRSDKYTMLAKHSLNFAQIAINREDLKKTVDIFNRVMPKDNIATIVLLENRQTGSRLLVANVHITWDPEYRDVKLVQVAILLEEIQKQAAVWHDIKSPRDASLPPGPVYTETSQIPLLICGDFNSIADSGVYELLSKGAIASDHDDLIGRSYGNLTEDGISHPFALKSSYSHVGELKFTNYTPGFTGVIDYIWYTANSLTVTGLLGNVDEKYLSTVPGFPNAHFPSDHILLQSEFQVKPRKEIVKKPPPPDFGSGSGNNARR